MKIKFWSKKAILPFLGFELSLIFSLASLTAANYSREAKLGELFSRLYDAPYSLKREADVMVSLSESKAENDSNQKINATSLFRTFYYDDYVIAPRLSFDAEFFYDNSSVSMFSLPTFSIAASPLPSGYYYLDWGVFSTYYSDDILGPRGYLDVRFGSDAFIFINDIFADALLAKYNIDSYETLILDERYCVLEISSGETLTRYCINNIISSTDRNSPEIIKTSPFFGVTIKSPRFSSVSLRFDFQVPNNRFCFRTAISNFFDCGASKESFSWMFFEIDETNHSYSPLENANSFFESNEWERTNGMLILAFCFSLLLFTVSVSVMWYSLRKLGGKISRLFFFLGFLAFVVYGCLSYFVYLQEVLSIHFVIGFIVMLLIFMKEGRNRFYALFRIKPGIRHPEIVYPIDL